MKIYLFDTLETHENLLPLSFTRPTADFRCGILTIKEKWERYLGRECSFYPVEYLRQKFGDIKNKEEESLFIAGNLLPETEIIETVKNISSGEAILKGENPVVFKGSLNALESKDWKEREFKGEIKTLDYTFDVFLKNGEEIKKDFELITEGRTGAPVPDCVRILSTGTETGNMIFIEEGAKVECISINVSRGPVYIGKDAEVMEGACIRGPFALCESSTVKMGAKIYKGTTIGPHCKVGGEISNTMIFGYSNKAHDGYLGDAVIGEWCNIGAGANASNLKNDYSKIRVWNYRTRSFMRTDLQFCGLIMGDHSKVGVNCMINTATVMGVGVNLHGAGFPRTYLPCFSEGSATTGFDKVSLSKFLDIAERVMGRRGIKPSESEVTLLTHVYEMQEK